MLSEPSTGGLGSSRHRDGRAGRSSMAGNTRPCGSAATLLPPCTSMTMARPACIATPLYSSPCAGPARCREPLQTGNYPHNAGFSADQIAAFPPTRLRAPTPPDHRPTPQILSGTAAPSCARGARPRLSAIAPVRHASGGRSPTGLSASSGDSS